MAKITDQHHRKDQYVDPSYREIIKERVEKGVYLLNIIKPDWIDCIDPDEIEFKFDGNSDILGQVFGSYEKGKKKLGMGPIELMNYGLVLQYSNQHNYLVKKWQKAIKEELEIRELNIYID